MKKKYLIVIEDNTKINIHIFVISRVLLDIWAFISKKGLDASKCKYYISEYKPNIIEHDKVD